MKVNKKWLKILTIGVILLSIVFTGYYFYTETKLGGYINPIDYIKAGRVEGKVINAVNVLPGMVNKDGDILKNINSYEEVQSYIGGDRIIFEGKEFSREDKEKLEEITKYYSNEFDDFYSKFKILSEDGKTVITLRKNDSSPSQYLLGVDNYILYDIYDIFINDKYIKSERLSMHFDFFYDNAMQHWEHGGEIESLGMSLLAYYSTYNDINTGNYFSSITNAVDKVVLITENNNIVKRYVYRCSEKDNYTCIFE